jgi:hypothetical protein
MVMRNHEKIFSSLFLFVIFGIGVFIDLPLIIIKNNNNVSFEF